MAFSYERGTPVEVLLAHKEPPAPGRPRATTGAPRSQNNAPSQDPTVADAKGSEGFLGGWDFSYERGTPVSLKWPGGQS